MKSYLNIVVKSETANAISIQKLANQFLTVAINEGFESVSVAVYDRPQASEVQSKRVDDIILSLTPLELAVTEAVLDRIRNLASKSGEQ